MTGFGDRGVCRLWYFVVSFLEAMSLMISVGLPLPDEEAQGSFSVDCKGLLAGMTLSSDRFPLYFTAVPLWGPAALSL